MTAQSKALEHLAWALQAGQTPSHVCASVGMPIGPSATHDDAYNALLVRAIEMATDPIQLNLVVVK